MIKKIFKKIYWLIGFIILIWILSSINFALLKEILAGVDLYYFIAATVLYLPIVLLQSFRWKTIMNFQNIHYSIKNAFLMFGSSTLLGLITPGRLGQFSKIAFLQKDNYSFGRAFLSNFLEKVFDLSSVSIVIIIGLIFLPTLPQISLDYLSLLNWLGLILGIFTLILLLLYLKFRSFLLKFLSDIKKDLKSFGLKRLAWLFLLTFLAWSIYFLTIYLLATSLDIAKQIGAFYLVFSAAFVILAANLPISVLGLGTREALLLFFLTPLGLSKEVIIAFSFLIAINYSSLLLIGLYCWFKKPVIGSNS